MQTVTLGRTGITVNKNGFGALPIQRVSADYAGMLLRKAYNAGITYFDTARSYSDSEEKMGLALSDVRENIIIATKTPSTTAEGFWQDLETSLRLLKTDYIDVYQFHNPAFCPKPGDGTGLYEAMEEAKKQGKIRFIGITNHRLGVAEEAAASGKVEYVAMCRQNIADPDCVNKALHGREDDICPCIRCNTCISRSHFYMKSPRCAANPRYNRGMDYNYMPPITKKKKVAVIGGGPAGIEAARVAAQRGHDVTLFEKSDLLGGVFRGAAAAPFKDDLKRYLSYVIRKAHEQENLTIRMCTEATPELLDAEGFDAAIIAIGNIPFFPKWLTCKDEGRVVLVNDVDSGAAQVGNNIVIVGAGITGLETAYRFVQLGRKVTVVDMLPRDQIAQTNAPINAYALFNLLENYDWDLRCETKLVDVTDDAVIVSHDGKEERLEADSVIIAMGGKANTDLIRSFEQTIPETYVVGDCNGELGNLWNSVTSAFDAAMVL